MSRRLQLTSARFPEWGTVLRSILTERCFAAYFFRNEDRNKYVSVSSYPTQGYAAHVEFGAIKAAPIRLTEQQVTALAEHLPLPVKLCAPTSIQIRASMTDLR